MGYTFSMARKAKPSRYRYRGVTIRERMNPAGRKSQRVECPLAWFGKATFRQFKTKVDAEAFVDRELNEREDFGAQGSDFTVSERGDALQALKLLKGSGSTLTGAVEFYLKHNRPAAGDRTVGELVDEYLERMAKGLTGKRGQVPRARSVGDAKTRLTKFKLTLGGTLIKDVASSDLEEWIYRESWSGQTQLNYFRVLHAFFAYAIKGKYLATNPLADVPRPRPEQKSPGILTVAQFEALLEEAECAETESGLLAYVVLAGFCGIRPEELSKLTWDQVTLEGRPFVTVPPGIAKGRSIRNVDIPACAVEWLLRCETKTGPIAVQKNFRRRWDKLRQSAGMLSNWPHDALRHSAGSYHYALHEDAVKTAAMLGHPNDTMLFKHYRALTTKKEAERFFSLRLREPSRRTLVKMNA